MNESRLRVLVALAEEPPLLEQAAPKPPKKGIVLVLPVPSKDAKALAIPGEVPASKLHVTLAWLGAGPFTEEEVKGVVKVVERWAEGLAPIPALVGGIGRFPGSATEGDPIYVPVDAPRLREREALLRALRQHGTPQKSQHGFNAHITLAYRKADEDLPTPRVAPREVWFDRVELWWGTQRFPVPLTADYDTPEKADRDPPKPGA